MSEVVIICMFDPRLAQAMDLWFVSNQNKVASKHTGDVRRKAEGVIKYQPSCGCPPAGTGPLI